LAERRPFPWVFPYQEDPTSGETHPKGRFVYRPVVSITLVGPEGPEGPEEATFTPLWTPALSECLLRPVSQGRSE